MGMNRSGGPRGARAARPPGGSMGDAGRGERPADIEGDWRRLTLHGHARFDDGDWDAAIHQYEQARVLALARFGHWRRADDAVAAVVVSSLNLSEGLARGGRWREASAMLCGVHGGMLRAASDADLPVSVRHAAMRHLHETYAALLRFQSVHVECPEVERWVQAGSHADMPAGEGVSGEGIRARFSLH